MVDGSVNPAITTWDVLKEMLWNNGINYHQPQLVSLQETSEPPKESLEVSICIWQNSCMTTWAPPLPLIFWNEV